MVRSQTKIRKTLQANMLLEQRYLAKEDYDTVQTDIFDDGDEEFGGAPINHVYSSDNKKMIGTHQHGKGFMPNELGKSMNLDNHPTSIPNGTYMDSDDEDSYMSMDSGDEDLDTSLEEDDDFDSLPFEEDPSLFDDEVNNDIEDYGFDVEDDENSDDLEGFDKELKFRDAMKKNKMGSVGIGSGTRWDKDSEKEYSPIKDTDLPLDKFLKSKYNKK